jgi:hypothetical protein
MDAFSYLSVLVSVVLGLAIQQVLQGYRALALNRRQLEIYWPSLAWSVNIPIMVVQNWWSLFGLADHERWIFADFAALLIQTAGLYMMAGLVLPDSPPGERINLKAHYYRERVTFFGFGLFTVLWSVVRERIVIGEWVTGTNLVFHAVFAVMSVTALVSRSERVHAWLAAMMSALFLLYIVLLFASLG